MHRFDQSRSASKSSSAVIHPAAGAPPLQKSRGGTVSTHERHAAQVGQERRASQITKTSRIVHRGRVKNSPCPAPPTPESAAGLRRRRRRPFPVPHPGSRQARHTPRKGFPKSDEESQNLSRQPFAGRGNLDRPALFSRRVARHTRTAADTKPCPSFKRARPARLKTAASPAALAKDTRKKAWPPQNAGSLSFRFYNRRARMAGGRQCSEQKLTGTWPRLPPVPRPD